MKQEKVKLLKQLLKQYKDQKNLIIQDVKDLKVIYEDEAWATKLINTKFKFMVTQQKSDENFSNILIEIFSNDKNVSIGVAMNLYEFFVSRGLTPQKPPNRSKAVYFLRVDKNKVSYIIQRIKSWMISQIRIKEI